jgi:hypothetical protein
MYNPFHDFYRKPTYYMENNLQYQQQPSSNYYTTYRATPYYLYVNPNYEGKSHYVTTYQSSYNNDKSLSKY